MKRLVFPIAIFATFLYACGGSTPNSSESTQTAPTVEGVAVKSGDVLIASSDCNGCHAQDEKLVGPSYTEIAAKYPKNDENIEALAQSIINGGSGKWGSVPMTPHQDMQKDEAKAIAKYILSLKK